MAEETSYQRHVGPWPIKRSQSVPDTSIFTPRNSPPSLASLLADVMEDKETELVPLPGVYPHGAFDLENAWSGYSMKQPCKDSDRGVQVKRKTPIKKRDQLGAERWMLQGVVVLGSCVAIFMPYCIVSIVRQLEVTHTTVQQRALLIRSMYGWLYFLATTNTFVASVAIVSLDMVVHRKVIDGDTIGGMVLWAFLLWMVMTIGWSIIVLL